VSLVAEQSVTCCFVAGDERSLILKKVEPWNSVRVTFNIPADAAERLRELAQHPNSILRELGILAVQIGSDHVMSLSGDNSSGTDTKSCDVVAGSCSQAVCQPEANAVFGSSGHPTNPSVQQFKVPTSIVPSCCPNILLPASDTVRTVAVQHPVSAAAASNFSVAQPRPVGLVRWPSVVPCHAGTDAVAVRFAVPSVPMKEFSQGLCFISPLRAAVSHSIASSSPLLVNLLQTQRQQGITAVPSQPAIPTVTNASIVPQKRRRNTSARKAKQPRSDQVPVVPVVSLQATTDSTSCVAQTRFLPLPLPATFAMRTGTTTTSNAPTSKQISKTIADENLAEESGRTRQMINPYTGNLELVDIAEDDGLSVSVDSSTEISASQSSQPLINREAVKSIALLNNDQSVTTSGLSNQILRNSILNRLIPPAVKASEFNMSVASGNVFAKISGDTSCTESPKISTSLVSKSSVSASSRYVDWYTASQSDKHNYSQCDSAQLLLTSSFPDVKQPKKVESMKFSNITLPYVDVSSSRAKADICSYEQTGISTVKQISTGDQPSVNALPKSSTVVVSSLESVKQESTSSGIPSQRKDFNTSCCTIPQLSTSQTDLIQMAFTLAKQNGSALHVPSLVDNWTKNAGLLQNSLQSLHGLQNIGLSTASIAFHTSSTATTSSCTQSKVKDIDGLMTTTTTTAVVSSGTCFFPAVSCFPPEHRRKVAVSIGGFGINPEPQLQTSTSGVASALVSTLPAVNVLTSASMPLEVTTCGKSLVTNTTLSHFAVSTCVNTDSNLLSSIERAPAPSIDMKKSIPLLTNLAPTSWPLMPNLLTVPLVNPTPLSGSPLLHCVTRAPLTPDGKLAGLNAAVTNGKGNIVPLAGRFCIPLPYSQAKPVTTAADKQNVESTLVSGIRPHTIMLTDNFTKFKLSVSSNAIKSPGKHGSSKDRRGSTSRTDDATTQRGSGKSHLTVAQLLDMAKNARLQQTVTDDELIKTLEQPSEPTSSVVTSASLQPQSALAISPPKNLLQLTSPPLPSSSLLLVSHNQSHAPLMSVQLSSPAVGTIRTSPTASAVLQTSSANLLSFSTTSSTVVSQPATALVASTLSSHVLTQPSNAVASFSMVSANSTAAPIDVQGKVSVESPLANEYVALSTFSSSASTSLSPAAYSVNPPLPITSPRYPLNLTESVKKAMRGVGLYPSPPVSPTTPLQTFGSLKLPDIRPYPVSIACSVPVSDLSAKRILQDRSAVTLPVMSQQQPSTRFNSAAVSCTGNYGQLTIPISFSSPQVLTTASNRTSTVIPATEQASVKNDELISHLDISDIHVVPSVTAIDSTTATDCILTCDSLFDVSPTTTVQPELLVTECSPCVSIASLAVACSVPKLEQLSPVFIENSSLQGCSVSSHITRDVSSLRGGLSASSGDSDMELRHDILEGSSSVDTDAGLSSLQSSPCSSELAVAPDSTKDANNAIANSTEVTNCVTMNNRQLSCDAVSSNAQLLRDGCLSLHCNLTARDGYTIATSLAYGVSDSTDVESNKDDSAAADSVHLAVDHPCLKAAADSSVNTSTSKHTLLKSNKLQTSISSIAIRSKAQCKRPDETDKKNGIAGGTSNGVDSLAEQQAVTSVGYVTRMKTRSSQRTTAASSTTELLNKTDANQTRSVVQMMPVKSPEKRGHATSESSNHTSVLSATKSVVVTHRRSTRILVAKVLDSKKSEPVNACQDSDSGIGLRSRRHAQKPNSIEVVTPRKRTGLRGTGVNKEDLCLVDSTENVVSVIEGSLGIEINMNDHRDDR